MKSILARWLALPGCALCLALAAAPAAASPSSAKQSAASAPAKKSKPRHTRPKPPTVTYADGQTVDKRQRSEEARLRRECRGRPNAGACLGYTTP